MSGEPGTPSAVRGPNPRLRVALPALVALAAAAMLGGALALRHDARRASGTPAFEGPTMPPGLRARDFSLADQDGRPASLAEYRGRVAIVTFLYTHCRDTCPVTAQVIREGLDQLGHDVPVLALSVDPAHDDRAAARRFLRKTRIGGRMRFLLGSRSRLAPVWSAYGIQPQGERFEHTAFVFLVDRRGYLRVGYPVGQLAPRHIAHDVALLERS
jgi:protein SCO1